MTYSTVGGQIPTLSSLVIPPDGIPGDMFRKVSNINQLDENHLGIAGLAISSSERKSLLLE